MQDDLNILAKWEKTWKIEFHPDKCTVLSITKKKKAITHTYKLHDHVLKHVETAKYLGCTINKELNWGEHITNITNKANRNLSFVRRNLYIASTKTKETAYQSLVRPSVEFASTVWDPYEKGDIHRLEMVQRRGARFVKNRYHNRSSVTEMLGELQWKSLQDRRREARLAMLYRINNGLVAIDKTEHLLPPTRLSRHAQPHTFQIPRTTTTYKQQSFFPRTIREWNHLPPDIVSVGSIDAFKAHLAKHFA